MDESEHVGYAVDKTDPVHLVCTRHLMKPLCFQPLSRAPLIEKQSA